MDHLFLYAGLPLVVTLTLRTAANAGQRVDRYWIPAAGVLAVPSTAVMTGVNLQRLWALPQPYASPTFTIVVAVVVVSTPAVLAIGFLRPRVLMAGALLYIPLGTAGLGQLIDSLTIQDARPGQAIAETPQAIAVALGSLLPAAALVMAGLAISLYQSRRAGTTP